MEFKVGKRFKDTRDGATHEIIISNKAEVVGVHVEGFRIVTKFETIEFGPREFKRSWTPRHLATGFRRGTYEWV